MATQAKPEEPTVIPFTPAQAKRVRDLAQRLNNAQAAFDEFNSYLAEEHGLTPDELPFWHVEVGRGALVKTVAPPVPSMPPAAPPVPPVPPTEE